MEVSASNEEFNKSEHIIINESNISKDIPNCNEENEMHNREEEKNIKKHLQDCDATSKKSNCYSKELENNETCTTTLVNKSYSDNEINLEKSENSNESRDSDKSCNEDNNSEQLLSKRFLNLVDSDSEDETTLYKTLKKTRNTEDNFESFEHSKIANFKKNQENKRRIIDSDSESEDTQISKNHISSQTIHKTINSYQSSAESESEEEKKETQNSVIAFEKNDISENKSSKKESVKKRKGSIRASKNEAMRQIHSESQRLLRETEISLPYHRPKQRTLQEFLNRKKVLTSLPKASSTAAKLKMSSTIVNQVLAEKEKEAEFFYKSSDSEDDMQPVSFASRNIKKSSTTNEKTSLIDVKNTHIQDSQKNDTSDQSFDNETKTVQDDVPLDTFIIAETDFSKVDHQNKESSLLIENSSIDASNTLLEQTNNINKQNQKSGVSRKLFNTCFEDETNEVSDINLKRQETTEGKVETIITSLEKKEIINNKKKKSEFNMTENHTSEISQCDSEAVDIDGDKNSTAETIEDISSNMNDEEGNVTSINSNIIMQNGNEDKKTDKRDEDIASSETITNFIDGVLSKIRNNPSTEECEDSDEPELDLPSSKCVAEPLIDRKKLSKLTSNSTVTLKGSPGMIIDLTNDEKSYGKGVNTLLDRFFCKHVVNVKKQANDKTEETEVQVQNTSNASNSSPIDESSLPYNLPSNIDNPELNKPGAKLMRLKEDLKLRMTIKRNKEWRHKEIELQEKEEKEMEEWEEEEEDYDLDGQDDDQDSELSGESEPEENDIYIKDKKRNKCLFADDEAEVTDNEDSDAEETGDKNDIIQAKGNNKQFKQVDDGSSEIETDQEEEDDIIDSDKDVENIKIGSESDESKNDGINVSKNFGIFENEKDKKKKQSTQESQERDSDIINPSCSENDNNQVRNIILDANMSETRHEDKDGLINEDKSDMSAQQQHPEVVARSQICKTPLTKKSMLDFVSPITQLSVLNTILDSSKKEEKKYPIDRKSSSMENTESDGSTEYNNRNKNISKKKLFDDSKETVDDEYLMRLCSGKFDESTQRTDLDLFSQTNFSELRSENTKLINAKLMDREQLGNHEEEDENSQDVRLILDEDSNNSAKMRQVGALKLKMKIASSSDDDDDDDQLDETLKLRMKIASSDDDQLEEKDTFLKPRKRSMKRFHLSDSEEEDEDNEENEKDDVDEEAEEQYVDYDSEENEMVIVPGKDIKKVAADFLEKEAELSESDWDSADEDERDLDKLEYEEGDDEHMDEHEMKDQLDKIHRRYMKEMLDEDKREVRLLQELLFEDGDLHVDGMGRERKFKWKNIDKLGNNTEMSQTPENDGWLDVQEDEEEAKWSKLRQERDKFLEERMKSSSNEIEDELCDSQIFKFGLEALKKIKNNECRESSTSDDKVDSSENIEPIMPRNITDLLNGPNTEKKSQMIYNVIKKRSLLTRGEESLAKIALLAKQGDSVSHAINARNFVFQYINENNTSSKNDTTKEEDQDSQIKPRKRKVISNFSSTTKKRRK